MQKKCEYVVKEANQPSEKAVRQFHEQIHQFIMRSTDGEDKIDSPLLETSDFTQIIPGN